VRFGAFVALRLVFGRAEDALSAEPRRSTVRNVWIMLAACAASAFTACGEATLSPQRSSLEPLSAQPMTRSVLIYTGDSQGVGIYDYASGTRVGEITHLKPEGMCVDKKGDVYIAAAQEGDVKEFARGGTQPISKYKTTGTAIGCAVDADGDVAVTDSSTYDGYGPGYVCTWKGGMGSSTCYASTKACYFMWPAGYDDKGNLFVEGVPLGADSEGARPGAFTKTAVCALLRGSTRLATVTLKGATITSPSSLSWDGKYIELSDESYEGKSQTAVYQAVLSTKGRRLTLNVINTVRLTDTCDSSGETDVFEPFVVGTRNTPVNHVEGKVLVGSNELCKDSGAHEVEFWHYPVGGDPYKHFTGFGSAGIAVSIGT
jgi:hypothetical protein